MSLPLLRMMWLCSFLLPGIMRGWSFLLPGMMWGVCLSSASDVLAAAQDDLGVVLPAAGGYKCTRVIWGL